jgi:hypothetical protein
MPCPLIISAKDKSREGVVSDHRKTSGPPDSLLIADEKRHQCLVDRRSGFDRRRAYSLAYFANGGLERRQGHDRRDTNERRRIWEMRGTPCPGT